MPQQLTVKGQSRLADHGPAYRTRPTRHYDLERRVHPRAQVLQRDVVRQLHDAIASETALDITEQGFSSGDACRVPWPNETKPRRPVWSREEEERCQHPEA